MLTIDISLLNFIYEHCRSGILDVLMPAVTRLGDLGMIWIALGGALLMSRRQRRAGAAILIALAFNAIVCTVILKPLICRIRPCDVNSAVQLLIARPTDYAFPSGHTAAALAAVSALYFSRRKLWIPAFVLAVLIAFSRLYLYVHYPTDIFTGAVIGIAIGYLGFRAAILVENLNKRRNQG